MQAGGRALTVELSGDLRVQLGGSLYLETGKRPAAGAKDGIRRKALAAFLDHHVLACVDPGHGEHQARFVYETPMKNGEQETGFTFDALTPDEARKRLQTWIQDLLDGDHGVLLPIEAVLDGWDGKLTPETIQDFVDEKLNAGDKFSTTYGPVPDPGRFNPPSDPREIMNNRLKDYLDRVFAIQQEEV